MPTPTSSLATLRPDLAGPFTEFDLEMDRQGFIGQQIFPVFPVAKKSGTFGKVPIEQLLQTHETERSPRGSYARGSWTFGTDSYACKEHGWEEPVDEDEVEMYGEYIMAEQMAAQRARDFVLRNAEIRYAALLFNTSTYTATSVTNEWDDAANATPIADVNSKVQGIHSTCGLWPNAIAMTKSVFLNLLLTDEMQAAIASSGAGDSTLQGRITKQQVAQAFNLPMVFVADTVKNTADEGQSASLSDIWDDEYVWIGRVATSRDIKEPCIGRTFNWNITGGDISAPLESYRDETVRADIIRARHDVQEKELHTECAGLLDNITS